MVEFLLKGVLYAIFLRFDLDDNDFFTSCIRARIVDFILRRKRYSQDTSDDFAFGIERLLKDGVYHAAYPLHDVSYITTLLLHKIINFFGAIS